MELKWLRGHKGVGVSLKPSVFDTKATFRTRKGIQVTETNMPFFREGVHIDESDRRKIISVLATNQEFAADDYNRVYDDTAQLITGARIVPERMVWQLLAPKNGKPGNFYRSNGVSYVYDYDPWALAAVQLQGSDYQGEVGCSYHCNPHRHDDYCRKHCSCEHWRSHCRSLHEYEHLPQDDCCGMKSRTRFLTVMKTTTAVLVDSEARSVVKCASGIRIHLYDKMFKPEETAAAEKYLPDGYVVLAPSGSLGNMYYVATPKRIDCGWHFQPAQSPL